MRVDERRHRKPMIQGPRRGGLDRGKPVARDCDGLRARRRPRRADRMRTGDDARGFLAHGAITGGMRSALAGKKARSKMSLGEAARGSSNDAAIVEIADFSLLSLTSPMPSSRASGVSIRVL